MNMEQFANLVKKHTPSLALQEVAAKELEDGTIAVNVKFMNNIVGEVHFDKSAIKDLKNISEVEAMAQVAGERFILDYYEVTTEQTKSPISNSITPLDIKLLTIRELETEAHKLWDESCLKLSTGPLQTEAEQKYIEQAHKAVKLHCEAMNILESILEENE